MLSGGGVEKDHIRGEDLNNRLFTHLFCITTTSKTKTNSQKIKIFLIFFLLRDGERKFFWVQEFDDWSFIYCFKAYSLLILKLLIHLCFKRINIYIYFSLLWKFDIFFNCMLDGGSAKSRLEIWRWREGRILMMNSLSVLQSKK